MAGTTTAGSGTAATAAAGSTSETDDKDKDKSTAASATDASAAPATGADSGATPEGDDEQPLSAEDARVLRESVSKMEKALREANKEAEKRRREAKAAETAGLPADEAAQAELADLRSENETLKIERAEFLIERVVTGLAPKLNLVDPEAVTRLIDWDDLKFDDGVPDTDAIEAAVKALLAKRPYLSQKAAPAPATRTGNNATDATSGSGPKPDLTAEELAAAERAGMTPEHYSALKKLNSGGKGVTLKDYQQTTRKA